MSGFTPEIRNAFAKWAEYTGNQPSLDEPGRYALLGTAEGSLHPNRVLRVSDSTEELLKVARSYFAEAWRGIEPNLIMDFQAESLETAVQEVSYRLETYMVDHKESARRWMPDLLKLEGGQEVLF